MPALRRAATPTVLLGGFAAASAALLLVWQSRLTFFIDDWDLLLSRRGFNAHAFLDPHNEHIIVAPTAIYKAIQATAGMDSLLPYALVATATFIASAILLFAYLSPRVGGWLALAATVLILFIGAAYEDLLTPFQVGYFGSMAFGLGALLALERRDRTGDAWACALLVLSLTFSELAVPFIIGIALAIVLDRGPWRRGYVVAVPLILYAIWYLGWGHTATSYLSFDNVANSPAYVLDGFASSIGSLAGVSTAPIFGGTGGIEWGRPLLVGLVVLAAVRLSKLGRFPSTLWVPLAIGISFWFLTAANTGAGRLPTASRYQYVGAVFVLMIAAELVRGWRPGWRALAVVGVATALAAASNVAAMHDVYKVFRGWTAIVRGDLGGLEIVKERANPSLELTPENSDFNYFGEMHAGPYLSAAEKFGSPAYTPAELASAPEPARLGADKVMAAALGLALRPLPEAPPGTGGCRVVTRSGQAPPVVELQPGGATLTAPAGVRAALSLRRFATASFPVSVGTLQGAARLAVPADRSDRPWQLQVDANGPVTVCPA
jgi:hypothetical protein